MPSRQQPVRYFLQYLIFPNCKSALEMIICNCASCLAVFETPHNDLDHKLVAIKLTLIR